MRLAGEVIGPAHSIINLNPPNKVKSKDVNSTVHSSKISRFVPSLIGVVCFFCGMPFASAEPMQGESEPQAAAKACSKLEPQPAIQQLIMALPEAQRAQLLQTLNQGTHDELLALPGIAETRSKAIQTARPFASVEDLLRVPGIGAGILMRILKHDPSSVAPAAAAVSPEMGS